MGSITGKTWVDHSEPPIMAADLEAIEAGIVAARDTATAAASTATGAASTATAAREAATRAAGIIRSTNLLSPHGVVEGHALTATGELTPNSPWRVSDFIPALGGVTYRSWLAASGPGRIAAYDAERNFLYSQGDGQTFTTPPETAFLRVAFNRNLDEPQLNLGPDLLPYEPYWVRIPGLLLPEEAFGADALSIDNPAGLDQDYTAPEIPDYLDLQSTLTSDAYGWWDALTADHPDYITRTTIGVGSGDTPIHSYTLTTPPVPTHASGTSPIDIPKPAILLISGVHGYEKASVRILCEVARALCEDWASEPVLDALRHGFEIVIVPVANPHSYDESRPGVNVRTNANGVDVARNFTAGWSLGDPATTTYGGPAPLSEPETVALDTLMQELASRCVLGASLHNFSAGESDPWKMIWNASPSPLQVRLGSHVISRVSRRWRTQHAWITAPEPHFGYSDLGAPGGSESRQMLAYGINGSTFEVSRICHLAGAGTIHDSRALTLGMEATVTYIAMGAKLGLDRLT